MTYLSIIFIGIALFCLISTCFCQDFDVADYHASSECKSGHGISPKKTFQPTIEYYKSTWIFPIVLLGLGLIVSDTVYNLFESLFFIIQLSY